MYISVHHVYQDSYGISHSSLARSMTWEEIEWEVTNAGEITDRDSIHNLVIDSDLRLIAQAGGYDEDRGLFVDMFDISGKKIGGKK